MTMTDLDEPGRVLLLMGNEAIARGALEAGSNSAPLTQERPPPILSKIWRLFPGLETFT